MNERRQTLNLMPNRCQNGIKIDAKAYQQSIQKLVPIKIRRRMKVHVTPLRYNHANPQYFHQKTRPRKVSART